MCTPFSFSFTPALLVKNEKSVTQHVPAKLTAGCYLSPLVVYATLVCRKYIRVGRVLYDQSAHAYRRAS
jgi:hypothetical protein